MNLYHVTVPLFIKSLTNLLALIAKAEKHAKSQKYDPAVFLHARLAPDMFDFTKQVQYAYFVALDAASKLSGKKEPEFTYKEGSLKELKESIKRTIAYLRTLKPADFADAEKKSVALFWDPKQTLEGTRYVQELGIPDFYFHASMCYAILRHNGVPLGKMDYLGELSIQAVPKGKKGT